MATHNDFGNYAEQLALDYLLKEGYTILAKNFRYQKAEIDIVAEKENIIASIEVKARSTDHFLLPQDAVTKSKMRLIVLATNHFLEKFNIQKEVRFDIISILPNLEGNFTIKHLKNAFEAFDTN